MFRLIELSFVYTEPFYVQYPANTECYDLFIVIQPRKLCAVDIYLLGPRLIIIEFAVAVLVGTVLGAFLFARAHSMRQHLFGAYILSLGTNYMPMLWHAVRIGSRERASLVMGPEAEDMGAAVAKYRRQMLYLLLPILTPVGAILERLAKE